MKPNRRYKGYNFYCLVICGLIIVLVSFIPARLAIAHFRAPYPQAIFTLGGDLHREIFTAQFAQMHPNLEIWVSSGAAIPKANWVFNAAKIPPAKVHLDRRAVDTLTNFTSLVGDFKKRNFQHVYLITADFHMRRAKAIATFVLGSQGIAFTPVSIPIKKPIESWWHVLRDVCRAWLWIFTRQTGATLNQ